MNLMPEYYEDVSFETQPIDVKFKMLLTAYSKQAKVLGIELVPYRDETFKRFLSFSNEKQLAIHNTFMGYYKICARAIIQEVDINNNHDLAWWALKEMNLRPLSDLFHGLDKNDIIEIYNQDFIQVFRTFNFFKLCSYSLDQILCYEWYELYRRDEAITKQMIDLCTQVVTGKLPKTFFSDYPDHIVEQPLSPDNKRIKIKHRLVSPLYGSYGSIYMCNVFRVSKIDVPIQPQLQDNPLSH